MQSVLSHVKYEESQVLPKFRAQMKEDDLVRMGEIWEMAKKAAPTLPHPNAPNTPPGNLIAGPMAAFFDKMKEMVSGGPQGSGTQPTAS
jgi:hypothetical protein